MHREHPVKILRYCVKNLWLLIFPLLRTIRLFPFSPQAVIAWFLGAWFDVLIFLMILGFAILRWRHFRFAFHKDFIRYESGLLLKKQICIPCSRITAATETESIFTRPLKLVLLKIDTAAARPVSGIRLWLHRTDLEKMRRKIPIMQPSHALHKPRRPGVLLTLLFSFLFSSSLSGTVYIMAFFFQAGSAARDLIRQLDVMKAIDEINTAAVRTFHAIPAVIVSLCIFLAACWTLSFAANLLHYGRFRSQTSEHLLSVHMGLLIRRRTHLRPEAVHYVISRQNLMMKLCGVYSMHLSCPGYGNGRKSLPVLIPLVTKKTVPLPLSALMPGVSDEAPPKIIRSRWKAIWSFAWQPLVWILGSLGLAGLIAWIFPKLEDILFFALGLALIPAVWLLLIRLISVPAEYAGYNSRQLHLHYSKGFSFYTIAAPLSHVLSVKICKTPMTARNGLCHVVFTLRNSRNRTHRLTGISIRQAEELEQFLEKHR